MQSMTVSSKLSPGSQEYCQSDDVIVITNTAQKIKFFIKNFFIVCAVLMKFSLNPKSLDITSLPYC